MPLLTARRTLQALGHSHAIIEFTPGGMVLDANERFCALFGYARAELVGQHHRRLMDPPEAAADAYRTFWASLAAGEYRSAEFRRIRKDGRETWIQASYNPVRGLGGGVAKIVKLATDITAQKLAAADAAGQIAAIGSSQAVIHFALDGTILQTNGLFLDAMGYTPDEVRGQHHRLFMPAGEAAGADDATFWQALRDGQPQAGEFCRIGKGGREVWIRATYTPIADLAGHPFKVVKYATVVTAERLRMADFEGQVAAIGRSQAVIQFELDGTIAEANDNFLAAMGYTAAEVRGQHHRIFVRPADAAGAEYARFWDRLRAGEAQAAEFCRVDRAGRDVWIRATYTPILDMKGRPFKVVKYATVTTPQVMARQRAAASAEDALGHVRSVVAATEQFSGSVAEITQSMARSRDMVDQIHERARQADEATRRLHDAAQSMDSIVQLIQQIASRITLLALNAAIESARAGEAGKGFAVVATEVKDLATQTTTATGRISAEIRDMQGVSAAVVGSLEAINQALDAIQDSVSTVAGAVERQSATTGEITGNLRTAAEGVAGMARDLTAAAEAGALAA